MRWLLLQTLACQIVGHLASVFLLSICSGEMAIEVISIGLGACTPFDLLCTIKLGYFTALPADVLSPTGQGKVVAAVPSRLYYTLGLAWIHPFPLRISSRW